MKKIIITIVVLCISLNVCYAGLLGNLFKTIAQVASGAVCEQALEYAGYSKEDATKTTNDLFNALEINNNNVQQGLNYVNASDKYERANIVKDYAFDAIGAATGQGDLMESLRQMADANLNYLHETNVATTAEEKQIAFDNRTRAYANMFYDAYETAKAKRAQHMSEKLQIRRQLEERGMDPNMANDIAGSVLAVQNSNDWTPREKQEYFERLGLTQSASEIAEAAQYSDSELIDNEEYIKQQEEEARRIKEQEEARKKAEAEAKRKQVISALNNTNVNTYKINSTALNEAQKAALDSAAILLNENLDLNITITGHTCDLGYAYTNQLVGQKRADVVKAYLVEKGVAEERIETMSVGKESPIVPNNSGANRLQNRCVTFQVK